MKQKNLHKFILIVMALWLGMTIVVDFISMPLAFKTLPSKQMAGAFGMKVFALFNRFEFVLAMVLMVSMFSVKLNSTNRKHLLSVIVITLFALSVSYLFNLTPQIIELSEKMKTETDQAQVLLIQKEHTQLHKFYVRLDTFKMVLLLTGLGMFFRKSEEA